MGNRFTKRIFQVEPGIQNKTQIERKTHQIPTDDQSEERAGKAAANQEPEEARQNEPEQETFTTQAAANYLGMSRQHLVSLLERNEIPHHKVGAHRRVTFKDLLAYEKKRDQTRRQALDKLASEVDAAGLYFPKAKGPGKDAS